MSARVVRLPRNILNQSLERVQKNIAAVGAPVGSSSNSQPFNGLIGIKKDKEISGIDCAMEEEVNKFQEGTMVAPEKFPMCSYLNSAQHNSWNDVLCKMFIEHFKEEQGIELGLDDKTTVENMFFNHLSCLVQPWNDLHKIFSEEVYTREWHSNQLS